MNRSNHIYINFSNFTNNQVLEGVGGLIVI